MQISFPSGVSVASTFKGHTVVTDQPVAAGGSDRAPAPFDVFLASIGTCAGYYALRFCQERNIDTTQLFVELDIVKDVERKRVGTIKIGLTLPPGFPEKYHEAIKRAVDQCAVKRHIIEAPAFEVVVEEARSLVESVG